MDCKIISQGQQNARRDSTFSVKNEGLSTSQVPRLHKQSHRQRDRLLAVYRGKRTTTRHTAS